MNFSWSSRTSRLIVLNTIGIGLLIALYFIGVLPIILTADKFFATYLMAFAVIVANFLIHKDDLETADWLGSRCPSVGLIFTVTGLIMAAHGHVILGGTIEIFKLDVINALVGNLGAMIAFLWIEVLGKFCK